MDHPVDLFFVFFDLRLLGGVIQIIGVFGDGEASIDNIYEWFWGF
jgi:hypothetical protein